MLSERQESGLVSIVIPLYKRLDYLPDVLQAIAAQDYPHIELIVSDNGQNGEKVADIVGRHYARPYRLRQNAVTVNIPSHYQQTLSEATGTYFVWLCDDDLIGPTFVSELVRLLEDHSDVSVAIARQEVIDTAGRVVRRSSDELPDFLSGEDFIRSWTTYKFENYATVMARTADLKECGGFADFPRGTASDDALLIKLCLKGRVAFGKRCTFQYRWHETSHGFSISLRQLADDLGYFLRFLDSDPVVRAYASEKPELWAELKNVLVTMTWKTYWDRWKTLYRPRLSTVQWVKGAFYVPFIPRYYLAVFSTLLEAARESVGVRIRDQFPWVYRLYRTLRGTTTA